MDESTSKSQDLNYLLFWVKETFTLSEALLSELGSLSYIQFSSNLNKLKLAINYLKRFSINFQIKYESETQLISLICHLVKELDIVCETFNNLHADKSCKNNSVLESVKRVKFILIVSIINNVDYCPITTSETI